ncbi:MAG: hypothetical protein ACM3UZ_02035, partial [Acidobacteriota bacterium]
VGKDKAIINGKTVLADPEDNKNWPILGSGGSVLVPLSFVSDNVECLTSWNPITKEIKISLF